jgi:hypothetical protein
MPLNASPRCLLSETAAADACNFQPSHAQNAILALQLWGFHFRMLVTDQGAVF